jgi:hypothetical protein
MENTFLGFGIGAAVARPNKATMIVAVSYFMIAVTKTINITLKDRPILREVGNKECIEKEVHRTDEEQVGIGKRATTE